MSGFAAVRVSRCGRKRFDAAASIVAVESLVQFIRGCSGFSIGPLSARNGRSMAVVGAGLAGRLGLRSPARSLPEAVVVVVQDRRPDS
jgi:hypothetical protein